VSDPPPPRLNWEVMIVCRDCGTEYEVTKPNSSVELLPKRGRMILVHVPNECPKCHSLHQVDESDADDHPG
jgi:hypothetical protein